MADKRIIAQTASTEVYNDDWLIKDSVTEGTTKISPDNLKAYVNDGVASATTFVDEYDSTETYNTGDLCVYEDVLYKALDDDITGTWDSTKWEETTMSDELADSGKVQDVKVNGVSVLDANKTAQIKSYKEVTQAEYDALPSSKLTDGVMYCISDSEFSAENVPYDNSDSGLEADNVQDAIDEEVEALEDEVTLREELESATKVYGTPKNLPQPIATFTDGANLPMPSLKIGIEPIQDLHGYDSPWVGGGGVNLLPEINYNTMDFTLNSDGSYSQNNPSSAPWSWSYSKSVAKASLKAGTYRVAFYAKTVSQSTSSGLYVFLSDGTRLAFLSSQNEQQSGSVEFTLSEDADVGICIKLYEGEWRLLIAKGSTAPTSWTPYSNVCPISGHSSEVVTVADDVDNPTVEHTYTIPFTDSQGNPIEVYGGECDVVNGTIGNKSNILKYVFTGEEAITMTSGAFDVTLPTSREGSALPLCSHYKAVNIASLTNLNDGEIAMSTNSGRTFIKDSNHADVTSFKAYLSAQYQSNNPVVLAYKIATPTTFNSQPTAIKSLEVNNVWGSTGNIKDLKYTRNLNITINDLISRVEALEG